MFQFHSLFSTKKGNTFHNLKMNFNAYSLENVLRLRILQIEKNFVFFSKFNDPSCCWATFAFLLTTKFMGYFALLYAINIPQLTCYALKFDGIYWSNCFISCGKVNSSRNEIENNFYLI